MTDQEKQELKAEIISAIRKEVLDALQIKPSIPTEFGFGVRVRRDAYLGTIIGSSGPGVWCINWDNGSSGVCRSEDLVIDRSRTTLNSEQAENAKFLVTFYTYLGCPLNSSGEALKKDLEAVGFRVIVKERCSDREGVAIRSGAKHIGERVQSILKNHGLSTKLSPREWSTSDPDIFIYLKDSMFINPVPLKNTFISISGRSSLVARVAGRVVRLNGSVNSEPIDICRPIGLYYNHANEREARIIAGIIESMDVRPSLVPDERVPQLLWVAP